MPTLTIGIIHSQGLKPLAATIKALRRQADLGDVELVVVGVRDRRKTRAWVRRQRGLRYVPSGPGHIPGALDQLFAEASGEVVLVLEGPVLLKRGALAALRSYYDTHPDTPDLLHGPRVAGKRVIATHSNSVWRGITWGDPGRNPQGLDVAAEPFVIPMQEAGVFSCRRAAWPGLPAGWRGYGAEAGYLQERFRQGGGQVRCLPGLRWERISAPLAVAPHSPEAAALLRNHYAGAADLGLDTAYIAQRFRDYLPPGEAARLRLEVLREHERLVANGGPLVSCLLYAGQLVPSRQALLEEAVASFLYQDYGQKELILLNDQPGQVLVCDAPGVRVVNTSVRCPSLGACYNAAAAFAQGEVLAPWSATGINLPWRLSLSVASLGSYSVYRPDGCWYMLDGDLDERPAQPDGGQVALFTREAFRAVGGYPSLTLGLHREMDTALDTWLAASGQSRPVQTLPREAWFTIVRRTQRDAQYQGDPFLDPWQAQGHLPVKEGRFTLRPHWEHDYPALCRERGTNAPCAPPVAPLPMAFVVGRRRRGAQLWLPRVDQGAGQTTAEHLERVAALVTAAVAAGGTHLVVPRAEASWLNLHPHLAEYLTLRHALVEASPEAGFIFMLEDEEGALHVAQHEVAGEYC
jgi:hypothetical protein